MPDAGPEKEMRTEGEAEGFVSLLGHGHIAEGRGKLVQILRHQLGNKCIKSLKKRQVCLPNAYPKQIIRNVAYSVCIRVFIEQS